jgi:photosystem II stability/assembly factor-like uncharacterized protein
LLSGCGDASGSLSSVQPTDPPVTTQTTTPPVTLAPSGSGGTPTGSTSALPPTTVPVVTGSWVNATKGLVGLTAEECGNMSLVSARPDKDVMIASIGSEGLWASPDGTDDWAQLGTGPGSAVINNRATSIIYDPEHPDTFWEVGIYHEGGIYRTDDGGITFRQIGADITHTEGLAIDFTDPARNTMLSTKHETSVTFKSTDGGTTWTDITGSLPGDIGYSNGPVIIDTSTYLLGTTNGAGAGIFRTADGATTWTQVFEGGTLGQPIRATSDDALYWLLDRGGGIIRSDDDGTTWTYATPSGVAASSITSITELPDGQLMTVGATVVLSSDHGVTWQPIGPQVPFVPNGFAYSPFHEAVYIWHFQCDFAAAQPIREDSIMRLDLNPPGS